MYRTTAGLRGREAPLTQNSITLDAGYVTKDEHAAAKAAPLIKVSMGVHRASNQRSGCDARLLN